MTPVEEARKAAFAHAMGAIDMPDANDAGYDEWLAKTLFDAYESRLKELCRDLKVVTTPGPRRDGEEDDGPRLQRALDFAAYLATLSAAVSE